MLSNEAKRQIFMQMRVENYRASLRLEGLVRKLPAANGSAPVKPAAALKTRNAR